MKKLIHIGWVSILSVMLVACGTSNETSQGNESASNGEANGDVLTIRAGIGLNSEHPQYKGLEKFKELVEERSGGQMVVETYHSGQLGDDRLMMEALQLGSQEVTVPSTAPVANFVSEFSVFDFPFLFPSSDVADEVLDGDVGQALLQKLEEQNLVGLAFWENGFRNVTNSKRPIETLEDFNGLTLRTMENDLHLEAFRALGANPTPMAFTELFTAMQQGTVDGQENPYATIYLEGYAEVQNHVSNTNHIYSPFVFMMSKPFFDGLTEEQQEIVREAALEAGQYQRELNREANETYLSSLEEAGMTYTEISEVERMRMIEAVEPVIDKYAEQIGTDIVQAVYDAIEAAQ
ncbi:TRAP transporter substrate-binding protein [Halalkalibacterium halodurans]|uniref:C4-dicarboxylate transport system (C4-dicarboxylate-binding protein) n=1 Tax=Halalkalibacterium halodurans (strain ATCC BAA-125 / DSM 18197 / FERM 7344 / JCM 9153 / C-125) TaxID=272558 RepID=Q9K9H4_HALH5|nr:TRAP transporter substrate-binding protein [Halalkalibacterium halodurans]MED4173392.1 TRAP transporter substrate-binding protein [Halalkalibacterium halodurans]BAB06392.1 C4-dicarboxylate transport system (C4-dicarboxylate-binding protein) [Halalkalibacterium halodurans C-125]